MSTDDLCLVATPGDRKRAEECLNRTDCLFITAVVPGRSGQRACKQFRPALVGGILKDECRAVLADFFRTLR